MLDEIQRYIKRNKSIVYIAERMNMDELDVLEVIANSEIDLSDFTSGIKNEDIVAEARLQYLCTLLDNIQNDV